MVGKDAVNSNSNNTLTSIPERNVHNNDTQLFYMYDLEEKYWWRWPDPNTDCSGNGYLGHEHAELSGIGPPILPENGLFLTWHFSLFSSLFNRMKRSRRRTYDPDKANLFIIPYDLGLDGYMDPTTCKNRRTCSQGHIHQLNKLLSASKYFQRYNGADHVVLWSLGQYHPWPRAGCDTFMKDFCGLCTITCYWMDPTKNNNRFVSVPFPSGYHWWDGIKNLPWDPTKSHQRNMTAVYLGSTQTLNPAHTKIRRAMTAQCNSSSDCHWMQIAHMSTDTNIADLLSVYKRATFCLCPPGDDPARKAVFDAIISGCIPVIFEVATLYNQYPWHIGEKDALDISVHIPGGQVRTGKIKFMEILKSISADVIRKKQLALAKVAPRVQYAIPPIEYLKNRSDATPWDPPFKDGVDITLDGLFERTRNIINNQSTGIPHRFMTGKEWAIEYDVVKIQVPIINEPSPNLTNESVDSTAVNVPKSGMEDKKNFANILEGIVLKTMGKTAENATAEEMYTPHLLGPGELEHSTDGVAFVAPIETPDSSSTDTAQKKRERVSGKTNSKRHHGRGPQKGVQTNG